MHNTATNEAGCPEWCETNHATDNDELLDGVYHDALPVSVDVTYPRALASEPEQLHVLVSRFVPTCAAVQPVRVEIEDNERTVATLSPDAARELAEVLTAAADMAEGTWTRA